MLGDQIGEAHGQITGTKVLSTDPPKVELSFQAQGKIQGIDTSDVVTYWSELRPDGTLYGEGEGVSMTVDGDVLTWRGSGVGRPTGKGMGASFRGAIYYHTTSPKLAHLNTMAVVFEYEADEEGRTTSKGWEWK